MIGRAILASKVIVTQSGALVVRLAQENFEGSHKKGEPHQGGDRPNIVTGYARRSIMMNPIIKTGLSAFNTKVGPTAIYGRRLELGFNGSKGYPFFGPAVERANEMFPTLQAEVYRTYMTKG